MKKLLSVILALGMILSMNFGVAEGAAPGNNLGFQALEALSGEGNAIVSPLSLAYALAMAAKGAEGETKQEILDALNVQDVQEVSNLIAALGEAGLKQANAAFLLQGTPKSEYVEALKEQFGAEWFETGENVADRVNAWVSEHTDGLIEKLLDQEPDPDTMLMLLNAIAMDAKWMLPFNSDATYDDVFHTLDGESTVPFMHQKLHAVYGEIDGVQFLQLGYMDSTLELLIALPEEGRMDEVLAGLGENGLDFFQFGEEPTEVSLSMPKLDLSSRQTLNDTLKQLGIETAFRSDADFSGIDEELYISQVLQQSRVIFDEDGTKAAAATSLALATCALLPDAQEPVEFNMNRPFAFAIADSASGAVCFAGIVENPVEIN